MTLRNNTTNVWPRYVTQYLARFSYIYKSYCLLFKLHFQSDKMSPKTKSSVPSVQPKPVNLDNTKNKNPASSAKDCTIPIDNSKPTQNSKSRKNKKKRNQNSSLVENSEPVQTKQPSSQTTSQSPATTPNICTKIDSQITVTSKEVKETCNRIDKSNLKHCYDFNLEVKVDIFSML